jgi:hypothetical protein
LEKEAMKFVTNNRKTLQIPSISKEIFKPDPTKKMPQIRHQTVFLLKKFHLKSNTCPLVEQEMKPTTNN